MIKNYALVAAFCVAMFNLPAQSVSTFINEISYLADDPVNRGLEIVGLAGEDMGGHQIAVYAADGTLEYIEYISDGVIPNKQNGYGAIWYEIDQTGDGGGVAFIRPNGEVVQFLAYGTTDFLLNLMTAADGPASGMLAQYIGAQSSPQNSLQLVGTGLLYIDFLWTSLNPGISSGEINFLQHFLGGLGSLFFLEGAPNTTIDGQVQITAFPNPTTDVLQLSLNEPLEMDANIEIRQMNGQLLQQIIYRAGNQQQELDVRSLPTGTYSLTVRLEQGAVLTTQLFVKQ
ncbi:MAG: T9SS type A sorting domain-containing protein [Saprospiraceae bacterium]|nr:T9SS type A sorting domain-containing protein [Saprospiraceae bacterium]